MTALCSLELVSTEMPEIRWFNEVPLLSITFPWNVLAMQKWVVYALRVSS